MQPWKLPLLGSQHRLHPPQPSMEPRPCSRGNCARPAQSRTQTAPFNGATALQPWKRNPALYPVLEPIILQWSHGLAAVETAQWISTVAITAALQWSHGLAAVETSCGRSWGWQTELLQWSHGLAAVETRLESAGRTITHRPSMEPRPCSRGNVRKSATIIPTTTLQWSHGLAAVETGLGGEAKGEVVDPSMEPRPCSRGNRTNSRSRWMRG